MNAKYEVRPLPATYGDVVFRSRLEARWAYYFDLGGIRWQYEPDAFHLAGRNYCPDFRLSFSDRENYYAEVKPSREHADIELLTLFVELTHENLILLDSEPYGKPYDLVCWEEDRYHQPDPGVYWTDLCLSSSNSKGRAFVLCGCGAVSQRCDTCYCYPNAEIARKLSFDRTGGARPRRRRNSP